MMQRADFERLALMVRQRRYSLSLYEGGDPATGLACDSWAEALADVCAASNPAFDRARFLALSTGV